MYNEQERRSLVRFIPYILITVSFVGWEVIKRTPVFVSTTFSQQALRIHGVISGLILLVFTGILFARFCLAGRSVFRFYSFEKYLYLLLFVDLVAFLIGLIHRNATVFLIGDTYKFAVIPLAYFCTTQTLKARDAGRLFLFIVMLEAAVTLESFGFYAVRLAMGTYGRAPQHAISLLTFIFLMTALASGDRLSLRRRNVYSAMLVVISLTAVLSQARTLWVQILLCPFILMLVERKTAVVRAILRPAAFALILLIPLLLGVGAIYRDVVSDLGGRIAETATLVKATLPGTSRIVEARAALSRYTGSPNVLDFVVGMGNGAEFYAPDVALGMGSRPGYKHHIHNGYVSLFFRTGIVGLIFFFLFAASTLKRMYVVAKLSLRSNLIPAVIFVYFVATLIELLTIYSFFGDIKWGILFGVFRCISPDREAVT
jgi:O-antigen ligase